MKDAHKEIMKECKKCIGQLAGGIKTKGSSYVTILSAKGILRKICSFSLITDDAEK